MYRAKGLFVRELSSSREIHVDVHFKLLLLDPQDVPGLHQPPASVQRTVAIEFSSRSLPCFLSQGLKHAELAFDKLTCFNPH